jgi:hypothetical protein
MLNFFRRFATFWKRQASDQVVPGQPDANFGKNLIPDPKSPGQGSAVLASFPPGESEEDDSDVCPCCGSTAGLTESGICWGCEVSYRS